MSIPYLNLRTRFAFAARHTQLLVMTPINTGAASPITGPSTSPAPVPADNAGTVTLGINDAKPFGITGSNTTPNSMGTMPAFVTNPTNASTIFGGTDFLGSTKPTTSAFGSSAAPARCAFTHPSASSSGLFGPMTPNIAAPSKWEESMRAFQESMARLSSSAGVAQPLQPSTAAGITFNAANTSKPSPFPTISPTVTFDTRFDRLEKQLELLNTNVTKGQEAPPSTQPEEMSARLDGLEKRLEDIIKGGRNNDQLDELNARFDRLEQRVEELSLNLTSQACSACTGLTITVRHGSSP
ncbi:hypothetical protein ONZ45_g4058 [Pleurotus djamor]|nr:hypothetical protein ONZ45_g4058 [Pleurotus djamor]